MKLVSLIVGALLALAVPVLADGGAIFHGGMGAAVQSGDSHVGISPTAQAGVFTGMGKFFQIGVVVGQEFHYNQKDKPSQSSGAAGSSGVRGTFRHNHNVDVDQDNDQTNTNNQNTDVVVNNNFPQPPTTVPAKFVENLNPSSVFYVEPTVRAGYAFGRVLPYVKANLGTSRVSRQDGNKDWGTNYGYGLGVLFPDHAKFYFFGAEISNNFIDTEFTHYTSVRFLLTAGLVF